MYINAKIDENELQSLIKQRDIKQGDRFLVDIENVKLYCFDKKIANDIKEELDVCISSIVFNSLDGTSDSYTIDYYMEINHDIKRGSFIQIKFTETKQTPTYLRIYFDSDHEITHVSYINKNDDEQIGSIEDTIDQRGENPLAGIYDVFNNFKTRVLKLKPKRKKARKGTKLVKFASHRVRFDNDLAEKMALLMEELISNGSKKGSVYSKSNKIDNGMREISLNINQYSSYNKKFTNAFKVTSNYDTSDKTQWRSIDFKVYDGTFEYISHEINVKDNSGIRYGSPERDKVDKFYEDEHQYINSLPLEDAIKWVIENKI